jgi:hypothetical protein
MKAALNWPVEIVHEKCQSSLADLQLDLEMVTITRRGVLTFHMHCFLCEDAFIVSYHMLELTTIAAMSDKEFLGDDLVPTAPIVMRPN